MRAQMTRWTTVLFAAMLAACAAEGADEGIDDTAEDGADLLDASKADSLASTSTYYTIRPDYRRCVAPLCGGYWVSRVNQHRTRCADGSQAAECYVADADWGALEGADRSGNLLVRGSIERHDWGTRGTFGRLVATEAWKAAGTTEPDGLFYRVRDNGVRCITYPCPSLHEAKLNSTVHRNISGLDLSEAGATDDLVDQGYAALADTDGLLVVGHHVRVRGPAGTALAFDASQFYLRVQPSALGQPCGSRGLAECPHGFYCDWPDAAMCGYADGAGTCQARPDACIEIYQPVCGCDGTTYGNDCIARSNGADVLHDGACEVECEPGACGPPLGLANHLCADGVTVAGPTGRCLLRDGGACGWEVISCPVVD